MIATLLPEITTLLHAIADRGGHPGTATVVLTDVRNYRWFYADGEAPRHATDPTNPDYPITLGRRTDELVPRVHAVCPACAAALRSTSDTHLPVYARIGDPPEAFVASVRFPPELLALALQRQEELANLPRQPPLRLEIRNTRRASRGPT